MFRKNDISLGLKYANFIFFVAIIIEKKVLNSLISSKQTYKKNAFFHRHLGSICGFAFYFTIMSLRETDDTYSPETKLIISELPRLLGIYIMEWLSVAIFIIS